MATNDQWPTGLHRDRTLSTLSHTLFRASVIGDGHPGVASLLLFITVLDLAGR